MNPIDNEQSNAKSPSRFKDVSQFTRMINNLDQQDKILNPKKRKRKWIFLLAGLFLLYLISFLFPAPNLSHESIDSSLKTATPENFPEKILKNQEPMTFEMPVDSFENVLKKHLHEKLPEKK